MRNILLLGVRGPFYWVRMFSLLLSNASCPHPHPMFVLGDQGEKGPRGLTGQFYTGIYSDPLVFVTPSGTEGGKHRI